LSTITIPAKVATIESLAFYRSGSLSNVIFENHNGWCRTSSTTDFTNAIDISKEDASTPSTMAYYLRSDNYNGRHFVRRNG
jgi:hypothetical protein